MPLYQNLIQEHFERCLDLYLCPRLLRKKVNVTDPSKLIPELPSPNDLKPFPTQVSIDFNFHKAMRMWKKDEMRGNYTVQAC